MKKSLFQFLLVFLCGIINLQAQTYIQTSFYSPSLDEIKKIRIYLPTDYYQNLELKHPMIIYLHGAGGDQTESYQFAIHYYATHNAGAYKDSVPPAIVVAPDGSCEPYLGSYWVNSLLYGNYENYVVHDLIQFVESQFRVMNDKNFRFITGYSMGGFGSAYLALRHPDVFRGCGPMSAAHLTHPDSLMSTWISGLYEENGDYTFQYNAGNLTKLFFTASGAYAPNMEIEPNHFESLWDTTGALVDSVAVKWENFNCSGMVSSLTENEPLSFFLICGTIDKYLCYPAYLSFSDSLDKYGIDYRAIYNEYDHGITDPEANAVMWTWMDSLAYVAFQYVSVDEKIPGTQIENIQVFPNPARDFINISVNTNSIGRLTLLDQHGRQVKDFRKKFLQGNQQNLIWNIEELPKGIYFLKLQAGNTTTTKKLLKQ